MITYETTIDSHTLVANGYKYSRKKCLLCVCTPGAGKTTSGAPYKATFPDTYGNVQSRDVARPAVISRHFSHSDGIDIHNHIRQHILALESSRRTVGSWFRLMTTMFGITVTDAFLTAAYRKELRDSHEDKCAFLAAAPVASSSSRPLVRRRLSAPASSSSSSSSSSSFSSVFM